MNRSHHNYCSFILGDLRVIMHRLGAIMQCLVHQNASADLSIPLGPDDLQTYVIGQFAPLMARISISFG